MQARQERNTDKQRANATKETSKVIYDDNAISRDEHDDDDEEDEDDYEDDGVTPMMSSHHHHHHSSLLQVPCIIEIPHSQRKTPVTTIIDTGAQVTVLSAEAAQKCGVSHFMDQRYAGQATGVGSCRVLGRIPAGCLHLHLSPSHTIPCPAITVLDNDSMEMDLLLGLDFLRDAGAVLNLNKNVMVLSSCGNDRVVIPFIRSAQHDSDDDDEMMDTAAFAGGWINSDIFSSLERSRIASAYDPSDDDEEDDESLDMSGV